VREGTHLAPVSFIYFVPALADILISIFTTLKTREFTLLFHNKNTMVCSRRKLQHAPITAPTHSIKRAGMSKSYDRSILYVGACDMNKSL